MQRDRGLLLKNNKNIFKDLCKVKEKWPKEKTEYKDRTQEILKRAAASEGNLNSKYVNKNRI